MTTSSTYSHDFSIHIKSAEFEFHRIIWEEEYEEVIEWEDFKKSFTNEFQTLDLKFVDFPLPEIDEDETIQGNEGLKGCEESYYYLQLQKFIRQQWPVGILDIDYEVERLATYPSMT